MAEQSTQDRTEQPTTRRIQKAREEGNVARSMDLNSVAVLIAGLLALQFGGSMMLQKMTTFIRMVYQNVSGIQITPMALPAQALHTTTLLIPILLPILGLIMIAGLGVNFAQIGFLFSTKSLEPNIGKLNPLKGIKNLFSLRSLVELIKGLLKMAIVGFAVYLILKKRLPDFWLLIYSSVAGILKLTGRIMFEIYAKVGLVLLALAMADFAYQRWQYKKNLRMTKQEVKDEAKEYENPEIKGRIRSMQRQLARKRMMTAVPSATVVVTNPTFIAVALKYEPLEKSDAPVIVAKGKRKVAEKIKAIARENNVPVIENKPLARSLYESLEVGMEIPGEFYQAVAEILVQVYKGREEQNILRGNYAGG